MKERLRLGQEQYKERVIECKHLQKELKKALNSGNELGKFHFLFTNISGNVFVQEIVYILKQIQYFEGGGCAS